MLECKETLVRVQNAHVLCTSEERPVHLWKEVCIHVRRTPFIYKETLVHVYKETYIQRDIYTKRHIYKETLVHVQNAHVLCTSEQRPVH